jgi:hypothetical protein
MILTGNRCHVCDSAIFREVQALGTGLGVGEFAVGGGLRRAAADVGGVDLAPFLGRAEDFLSVIPAGDQMVKTALEFDAKLPCHPARDDSRNFAESQT